MRKKSFFIAMVAMSVLISGCAQVQEVKPDNIISKPIPGTSKKFRVRGVNGDSFVMLSLDGYRQALINNLNHSGIYSPNSRYGISANIRNIDYPYFVTREGNATVTYTVEYSVVNPNMENVFSKTATTSSTATAFDASEPIPRMSIATQRAVSKNIDVLFAELQKYFKVSEKKVEKPKEKSKKVIKKQEDKFTIKRW